MTTSSPLPPAAATKSHAVVEGRLAKLEAKLAETQAELIALKSIERNNLRGEHFAKKATTPMAKAAPAATGDEEDVVAMAVHLGLDVSCTKEMSAQQRWLVRRRRQPPTSVCFSFFPLSEETRHVCVGFSLRSSPLPPPRHPTRAHTY